MKVSHTVALVAAGVLAAVNAVLNTIANPPNWVTVIAAVITAIAGVYGFSPPTSTTTKHPLDPIP